MQTHYPDKIVLTIPFEKEYYEDYPFYSNDYVTLQQNHTEHYRLLESPHRASGIAIGDIVKVIYDNGEYFFNGIAEESGYSVINLSFSHYQPLPEHIINQIHGFQVNLAAICDNRFFTVNIPPSVNYAPLKEYLETESQKGNLYFRELCIRKHHFLTSQTITWSRFWQLIKESYKQSQGNAAQQIHLLTTQLLSYSPEQIIQFEKELRKRLYEAATTRVKAAMTIITGSAGEEAFLHFRCWLICQGQNVFSDVLENPDNLILWRNTIDNAPFQAGLLPVATNAWQQITGYSEKDNNSPQNQAATDGFTYHPAENTDLSQEQLPVILPRLWARYKTA